MSNAHPSQDPQPPHAVATAMAGLMEEFKGFQGDLLKRMQQNEERTTMLDRKSRSYSRPNLALSAEVDVPHRKAFDSYLRLGNDDGLRGLVLEGKGLNTAVNGEGGYLVDPQTSDSIRSVLNATASLGKSPMWCRSRQARSRFWSIVAR